MARDAESAWRLQIAEGPNAGAELDLAPGLHRIGADADNDIVVSDTAVALRHLSIEIGAHGASWTAHEDGAALHGRAMPAGVANRLLHGAELRIGETLLRVSGPPAPPRAGARALLAGAGGIGVMAALATYLLAPASTPAPQSAALALAAAPVAGVAVAERDFTQYLRGIGLGRSVRVAQSEGAVLASGAILPAEAPGWHEAQAWFDRHYGGRVALIGHPDIALEASMPTLDVAAVSFAPVASVITRDGERYTTGAVLPGGWTIVGIAPGAVTLRGHGRDVQVTL